MPAKRPGTAWPVSAATAAVVVGREELARSLFDTCTRVTVLDNGLGIDNEEQDQPVAVCRGPIGGWDAVWPAMRQQS